jgi:membrane associated rhomboid family serine protease
MQNNDSGRPPSPPITPLVRATLTILIGAYLLQLVGQNWLSGGAHSGINSLKLWSFDSGHWRPWQPFTSLLLNGGVLEAFFDWLFLFFLMGPVEQLLGNKRFKRAMVFSVTLAIFLVTGLDLIGAVSPMAAASPFTGVTAALLAMLVIFGLSMPNAQILLFFVLPIKAVWIARVSGLLSLLMFLASRDLTSAMAISGWIGGFVWIRTGGGSLRRLTLMIRKKKLEKELGRFTVIPGGKNNDPTIH